MVISVEDMRLAEDNSCEKSNDESENCTEEPTEGTDKEPKDEAVSSPVNGVKSDSAVLNEKAVAESDHEENEDKQLVEINENVLSNGIVHDVVAGILEKNEETEIPACEAGAGELATQQHDTTGTVVDEEAAIGISETKPVITKIETKADDETADEEIRVEVKNISTSNKEKLNNDESWNSVETEERTEVGNPAIGLEKSQLNVSTEMSKTELLDDKAILSETTEETIDIKETDISTLKAEEKDEKIESSVTNVEQTVEDPVVNEAVDKECEKEDGSLVVPDASVAAAIIPSTSVPLTGMKRKLEPSSHVEPDRDGGISSSSSSSSSSGSEAENPQDCKRIRFDESIFEEDERERLIREFAEKSTGSFEEIGKNCEKLQHEIAALSDLARAKELEWNSIMRLLKLKEEMLERILFKKRHLDGIGKSDFENNANKTYKSFASSSPVTDHIKIRNESSLPSSLNNHISVIPISASTTVPNGVFSSSSQEYFKPSNSITVSDSLAKYRPHRPILPKPSSAVSPTVSQLSASLITHSQLPVHSSQLPQHSVMPSNSLILDQNSVIGEGRQGPIVDVKSIIADFRSKNPDSLPRRGRRNVPFGPRVSDASCNPRFLQNTALLSMANMALGSGSHVRASVSSTTQNENRVNNFFLGHDGSISGSFNRADLQIRPAMDSLMLSLNNPGNSSLGNSSQKNNVSIHNSNNTNSNISSSSNAACNSNFNSNSCTATITTTSAAINNNCSNNGGSNTSNSNNDNENENNNCFQEALAKFAAKMNEKRESVSSNSPMHISGNKIHSSHLPPPPPYPEVTLHPVLVPPSSSPAPLQNSLLHGILTKSNSGVNKELPTNSTINSMGGNAMNVGNIQHRPTTFSPTLARLLTAPERNRSNRPNMSSANRNQKSTLSEILNSKKTRTEVTITPVTTNVSCSSKSGSDVVLVDDDDESESTDRLVIDEGREMVADSAPNVIPADQVPECQGCHRKAAQFVCAGCGNQWYCSRECQVHAWEDHSEMCSG